MAFCPLCITGASGALSPPCGRVQPVSRPLLLTPDVSTTWNPSALSPAPTWCKRSHEKKTTASRTPLVLPAPQLLPADTPMEVLRAHDGRVGETKRHGGVIGDQTALPEQHDAANQRAVPRSALGSSWSTSRPAHAGDQQEVDGHEPARPDVSPGTHSTRPSALAPLRKSSMASAVARAHVEDSGIDVTPGYGQGRVQTK